MTPHALRHSNGPAPRTRLATRWLTFVNERFLWLPIGAALAFAWVNLAPEAYFTFAYRLAFPVNEIGMALFIGLLMQEIVEALIPGGALHTWRRWTMAIVAAGGGILGAALAFLTFVTVRHEAVLVQAWPVACAVDIAAGYYILRLVFRRGGTAATFLLAIGVVTNAAGLLVLALWPAVTTAHLVGAVLVSAAAGVAALMRRARVPTAWPYLIIAGTVSWFGFAAAGVHPALALVPIIPFVPRESRPREVFAEPADDDAVHHAEREWNVAVQAVLFLFGLVNAGIVIRGYDTGTWAVIVAALIGRPIGIIGAVALGRAAGLHLPRRLGWRQLVVVAAATSSGFTFALFAATTLLPAGGVLTQIKVGALLTAAGALMTLGIARGLHVGRFAHRGSAHAAHLRSDAPGVARLRPQGS